MKNEPKKANPIYLFIAGLLMFMSILRHETMDPIMFALFCSFAGAHALIFIASSIHNAAIYIVENMKKTN